MHDVYSKGDKPLECNKYLPWQDSLLQPANGYSLASTISTTGINCPKKPAFSPAGKTGESEKKDDSEEESPKPAKNRGRKSLKDGRLSVRNPTGINQRESLFSQRGSMGDTLPIPKLHECYYDSPSTKEEVDNHAAWISFILFDETKKIERLAKLEEDDEELTLELKKRSTMINVATTTNTKKNFTKKERNFEESIIEFNHQAYDRRRASSVIQKITAPMPKGLIE